MTAPVTLFWFRRDLRLHDNAGLYYALKQGNPVLPLFIFDRMILDRLDNKQDKRVSFIYEAICHLKQQLQDIGTDLKIIYANPEQAFRELLQDYSVNAVYTNHDYEPAAIRRDEEIARFLKAQHIGLHTFKDQVIFDRDEVVKDDQTPYTVFTPYSRKWLEKLDDYYLSSYPVQQYTTHFHPVKKPFRMPALQELGFEPVPGVFHHPAIPVKIIGHYEQTRDYPALHGTSRLSVHLRFGTVSIRELVRRGKALNDTWLKELIWREFYMAILYHFPHVDGQSFKKQYDLIPWRNNEQEFEAWCQGRTGYPIVDAGMRELNSTGFMHNRVRMITASFLTKHLLIDWRWGEAYFAEKLLDYDLAANNGGWQWAASSGCDAVPYFRIFNPGEQARKFDPESKYIRKWIPELGTLDYPGPIVEHKAARERALTVYKKALQKDA